MELLAQTPPPSFSPSLTQISFSCQMVIGHESAGELLAVPSHALCRKSDHALTRRDNVAGTVVEVGPGVKNLKPGDDVALEPGIPCWSNRVSRWGCGAVGNAVDVAQTVRARCNWLDALQGRALQPRPRHTVFRDPTLPRLSG